MFRTLAVTLLVSLAAAHAHAQCTPADLRDTLTPAERDAIALEVAATPHGVGRLFTATRGEETLTLFGTFHASAAGAVPTPVIAALEDADALRIEVTTEQQIALQGQIQQDMSLILDLEGPGLQPELSDRDWQKLVSAGAMMAMPPQAVDRLQPWFAATLMALPACEMMLQATGKPALDALVEGEAIARGIPVAGLETATEALSALTSLTRTEQLDFLRMSLASGDDPEALFMTTALLYSEGRIAEILALSNTLAARQFEREEIARMNAVVLGPLLEGRNAAWLPEILAVAAEGPAVIAVGALHLGGETGLLRLLEAEGFTTDRIILDGEVAR